MKSKKSYKDIFYTLTYRQKYEQVAKEKETYVDALQKSEAYNRLLFNSSPIGLVLCKMDGSLVDINPAYSRIIGRTIDETLKLNYWDITPDKYNDQEAKRLNSLNEIGSYGPYEKEYIHKDGHHVPVLLNGVLIDRDGEKFIWSSVEDITERKKTETAIYESEQKFASIFNTVGDVIFYLTVEDNGQYRFAKVNDAFTISTGIPKQAVIGKLVNEIIPEPSPSMVLEKYKEAIEKRTIVRWEEHSDYPTGHLIGEVSAAPVFDKNGHCTHLVGSVHDITERKRDEDIINNLNKQLLEAEKVTHFGFLDWNLLTNEIHLSPEVNRIYEVTENVTNKIEHINRIIHPDDVKFVNEQLGLAVRGIKDYNIDHRIVQKDGTIKWLSARAELFTDENNKPVRLLGTILDITERKEAEEEIQKLNSELEQRVIERTAQLEDGNKELESFSYSVSHDLRAPLRAIDGFSHALLEDYFDQLDEKAKNYLDRIRSGAQRMSQLIDDMLNLAKVTRTGMNFESVNLSEIAESICKELHETDLPRNAEFIITPDLIDIADPALIRAVMLNLLDNAWKFTSKKPDTLIEFGITDIDGKRTYFIRDNGDGFNMKYIEKLFSPFQRLHQSTEFAGTGIGLATVKRIINRHKGKIWAEGKEGSGATFYFTLNLRKSK